jgi:TetR/AcrR family transcriptional repressor of lmrAB and yxaGH operons
MPPPKSARRRIVETAGDLFGTRGYAATTLRDVVEAANAPWGSLHHYFPGGKEQLAVEALELRGAEVAASITASFAATRTAASAMRRFFDDSITLLERAHYGIGCPVAAVVVETANDGSGLRRTCGEILATWSAALEEGLRGAGIDARRARTLARLVIAQYEGALLLARVEQDASAMRAAAKLLGELVDEATPTRG